MAVTENSSEAAVDLTKVGRSIRSLDELREADDRTLVFGGLGLGGRLRPEEAAAFQQHTIDEANLVAAVPEGTRESFERLRTLHAYGVLCYETFTVAEDLAHLTIEQALRERFLKFYDHVVPFISPDGQIELLDAPTFEVVYDAINGKGRLARRGWGLDGWNQRYPFRASLSHLYVWARRKGLLPGQRNKGMLQAYMQMRHLVAHPSGYHLSGPVESAQTIRDLAEFINQLWGVATPGGRLFPAPLARDVMAIGWGDGEHGPAMSLCRAELLDTVDNPGDWTYVIVRAVADDPGWQEFDARFESTCFPCDLLWGPGQRSDAVAWLAINAPARDEASAVDRLFALRVDDSKVSLPRRPAVALGVPVNEREGTWHLVRADQPVHALSHVCHLNAGIVESANPREQCLVEDVFTGSWEEVADRIRILQPAVREMRALDVHVPARMELAPDVSRS